MEEPAEKAEPGHVGPEVTMPHPEPVWVPPIKIGRRIRNRFQNKTKMWRNKWRHQLRIGSQQRKNLHHSLWWLRPSLCWELPQPWLLPFASILLVLARWHRFKNIYKFFTSTKMIFNKTRGHKSHNRQDKTITVTSSTKQLQKATLKQIVFSIKNQHSIFKVSLVWKYRTTLYSN